MNESLEQTIKRLEFCRDCIDQFYEAGQKEYNRLECIIEELKHNCPNKQKYAKRKTQMNISNFRFRIK